MFLIGLSLRLAFLSDYFFVSHRLITDGFPFNLKCVRAFRVRVKMINLDSGFC